MAAPEHGGGLDAAAATFGGQAQDWLDLSTGINPQPWPVPGLAPGLWSRLPDHAAMQVLLAAARGIWNVPNSWSIVAAPGTSALIAAMPRLEPASSAEILAPTYNEHERAFSAQGWRTVPATSFFGRAAAQIAVSPNNPDGRILTAADLPAAKLTVIDESFADALPGSAMQIASLDPSCVVLKGIGKFWGLAGLRLGFAICSPDRANRLHSLLGPWPVSGPALAIGAAALADWDWQRQTRLRLARDATRLDILLGNAGLKPVGGTPLFRLTTSPRAVAISETLARRHILVRRFAAQPDWLRFGLPGNESGWERLGLALEACG